MFDPLLNCAHKNFLRTINVFLGSFIIYGSHFAIRTEMHCGISVLVTFELPLHLIVYLGINQTI